MNIVDRYFKHCEYSLKEVQSVAIKKEYARLKHDALMYRILSGIFTALSATPLLLLCWYYLAICGQPETTSEIFMMISLSLLAVAQTLLFVHLGAKIDNHYLEQYFEVDCFEVVEDVMKNLLKSAYPLTSTVLFPLILLGTIGCIFTYILSAPGIFTGIIGTLFMILTIIVIDGLTESFGWLFAVVYVPWVYMTNFYYIRFLFMNIA